MSWKTQLAIRPSIVIENGYRVRTAGQAVVALLLHLSPDQVLDDVAVDIGQTEMAALVLEGQTLVINSH